MAKLNLWIDAGLKDEAEALFRRMGMDLKTAVSIFLTQSVREGGFPFVPTTRCTRNAQQEFTKKLADALHKNRDDLSDEEECAGNPQPVRSGVARAQNWLYRPRRRAP